VNPQFPLYIVSKGRHESRMTAKALDKLGVPFRIIVEAQERDAYAAVIDPERVLVLDPAFQRDFDAFSNLGVTNSKGSGPARNFAWAHSISQGHAWHWVMDDNIWAFYRFNQNKKLPVGDGTMFRAIEDFCLRYRNVSMAGPNYDFFVPARQRKPPITLNTRIYSCNLIRNDTPFRWRGRYNEDTDLSLRMLKRGWCTVLFNAFLQKKTQTGKMKGGNTDSIYVGGTLAKSQMLVDMHPDVTELVWRFGRWHHKVNYKPFRANKLILRPGVTVPAGVDDFGMVLHHKAAPAGNQGT
jgi:hypothetical protein